MKLMTKELERRFEKIGNQSEIENPVVVAKYFNPVGSATWYATEYDPQTKICYGYVTGMYADEWGTFSLTEFELVQLPFGMKIERDLYFKETTFDELIKPKTQKRESELKDIKENTNQKQDLER